MSEVKIDASQLKDAHNRIYAAADAYAQATGFLTGAGGGASDKVTAEWTKLRDDVQRVISGSADNLIKVGKLVIKTAEDMGVTDAGNAKDLDRELDKLEHDVNHV
ncbi:MAG TPA: hypothetical protein VE172_05055 [Stackebrandtia sp.]|jgi:uncharacterized protein YPO0396|uniref:hypothetical protein n=1 Tax=Stackebrandtia sp. TaxID=2023065 RepID=UPI002D633E32|nr:hypothetical protein [Stackebrandtia sp.]HZE38163.1 hypothetical protein [Stackebrandtia sp.]